MGGDFRRSPHQAQGKIPCRADPRALFVQQLFDGKSVKTFKILQHKLGDQLFNAEVCLEEAFGNAIELFNIPTEIMEHIVILAGDFISAGKLRNDPRGIQYCYFYAAISGIYLSGANSTLSNLHFLRNLEDKTADSIGIRLNTVETNFGCP